MKIIAKVERALDRIEDYAVQHADEGFDAKRKRQLQTNVDNAKRVVVAAVTELAEELSDRVAPFDTPIVEVVDLDALPQRFDFGGMKHACDDVTLGTVLAIDSLVGEQKADAMRCTVGLAIEAERCTILGPSSSLVGATAPEAKS